ncbi:MAG: exodeoxyribonuclease VII large subunit [Chloroflexi bacterium]|nr:exodeoxyribonuclease VII large subunit [Chloroflexota bacterium]MCI0648503.1 exodeoxyribonuclease VII large subunit [Chloroflexota bacterium]MCI0728517.1 exodeoxyribonuclease VII large subunit [Chloroflexota bacterium]
MRHLADDSLFSSPVWTVSDLTVYIRELFDIDYRLQDVQVSGEISNFTQARSGHLYFTLKDSQAQLKCVMWRSSAERLRLRPQDGDAVLARGRVSIYEAGGVYQLYVDSLQPAGRGDLALAFELLKERLALEGLFDATRKRPLPAFPRRIGIVTSADAAALRDILNVLRRRMPLVSVLVAPTLVQGREAPPQIIRALQWLDGRDDIDVIIVARGGGAIEDLWAFNDENVARAICATRHPVISGVGHETDFTIADFVADVRAPTPSAAAELAVPDMAEIALHVQKLRARLVGSMQAMIGQRRAQAQALSRALGHLSPRTSLNSNRQRLDSLVGRLDQAMQWRLERNRSRLAVAQAGLAAVGPLATLSRGYAIVRRADGQVVRSVGDVAAGEALHVQVSDGEFGVRVEV